MSAVHGTDIGCGIRVVDTGFNRARFDAAYLVVEGARAAVIDTGPNVGVAPLLAALAEAGVDRADVPWLIVTHVHLDHAGGAGLLMQSLPNATLVVHPRGARHLIDPAALVAGATAVYGEDTMRTAYGRIVPVDAARVRETHDGLRLALGAREFEFWDTPGHARHHHCIRDEASRGFFTGDTFGISYRELDSASGPFLLPTTTPVQFEPAALRLSVERLLAANPERMYLTHYGAVGRDAADVRRLGAMLLEQVDAMVALGRELAGADDRQAALERGLAAQLLERLRAHGCRQSDAELRELLAIDIELNAQGLGVWLDRGARGEAA